MLEVPINGKILRVSEEEYYALLRYDAALFMERSFAVLNPHTPYLRNWHIELIARALEECRLGTTKNLIINVPPRSLKSHCASIAFPAWLLGHNPSAQIICVSYGQDLADTLGANCRTLMLSPFYQRLFQTRLASKRQPVNDFYTTLRGFRMATSVGGVLTGRGADVAIIDDPLKPDEAMSEVQRNNCNEWFKHTLLTRLNDKRTGCIIIIMQRLHEDDLVGHVLRLGDWKVLKFPAIAEKDEVHEIRSWNKVRTVVRRRGQALHSEREPLETLNVLRENLGEYQFAGQYQQAPAPLGGGMIKRTWFQKYAPHQLPQKFDLIYQSWDTANKASEINDFSVCTTWGAVDNHLYLLDHFRARLEYPDLKRTILRLADLCTAEHVVIEDKASGTQLLQDLKNDGFDRATAFKSDGDKVMRMFAVTNTIENGFVHVPEIADWVEPYLYELMIFPNGKFDDQVDSTSQALLWFRDGYSKYRLGLVEYLKQGGGRMTTPKPPDSPVCSKCCKPMGQKVPGGLRCGHCGEQWVGLQRPRKISRHDVLRTLARK
jgi:predicted phage terminase large subunit-like protein